MAAATNTPIRLSRLTADPVLSAFFERGERFSGDAFAVSAPRKPRLSGGAVRRTRVLELA